MGNNNRINRGKQKSPRYTGKNVDPMGDPGRMGKYAINLFKDMAGGRFQVDRNLPMFQNRDFVLSAISEVNKKIREQNIYLVAMNYAYGSSDDPMVIQMINKHTRGLEAWGIVLQTLYSILNSGDTSFAFGLMNRLPDFKYVLY